LLNVAAEMGFFFSDTGCHLCNYISSEFSPTNWTERVLRFSQQYVSGFLSA